MNNLCRPNLKKGHRSEKQEVPYKEVYAFGDDVPNFHGFFFTVFVDYLNYAEKET
jgi:hypothetical protein